MDITEPILPAQPAPELLLGDEAKYYLNAIGKWASFFSVLGYIVTAFIVLAILSLSALFAVITAYQQKFAGLGMGGAEGGAMASGMGAALIAVRVIYLIIAVINFFGAFYLGRFAARIKRGVLTNDTITATSAFENLKSFFKLIGITTIVLISLDVLFFVIFIIAMVGAASAMR